MALRFVHCSDIHLLDLEGVGVHRFLNKRLTGGVNLALGRRKAHSPHLFDAIIDRARALKADRLVVTGDVTNLALEAEFELVRRKFGEAGLPVTVIPGNHDAYTKGSVRNRRFEQYLNAFMEGERQAGHDYPFVQRFGGVALIGLSTAIATLPLYATGRLGGGQLARLDAILKELGEEGVARVVLIHHPVVEGVAKARHDLLDLDAFGEVIRRRGAELILHGHEHIHLEGELPGPDDAAVVHGIASGTALSQKPGRNGAFSLYTVAPEGIHRAHYIWDGDEFVAGQESTH
ncbi:MAG: metallophosphoesterase [Myxococcales bacterium]|nr:metallophosphoesterase [Myxococcales bacterium]